MFLEISKANYIADYKIELTFNTGEIYLVDLAKCQIQTHAQIASERPEEYNADNKSTH